MSDTRGKDRKSVTLQGFGNLRTDLGALDRAGHDESRLQLAISDLDPLLYQLDQIRRCPNVIRTGLHRNQYEIGSLDRRHGQVGRLGRSVDHHKVFPGDVF
ncbi:hypothetical protein D3C78_1752960 [compost metagenome]